MRQPAEPPVVLAEQAVRVAPSLPEQVGQVELVVPVERAALAPSSPAEPAAQVGWVVAAAPVELVGQAEPVEQARRELPSAQPRLSRAEPAAAQVPPAQASPP